MIRSEIHFPAHHEALRDDVHALGGLIGEILREQGGDALLDMVEHDRVAAIAQREHQTLQIPLAADVRGRDPPIARNLVRAFSTWFQAVNLAERVHRIRRRREYLLVDRDRPQPGGIEHAFAALKQQGFTYPQVMELLGQLSIEPVFTAHPTESTRRTILRKHQRIARLLVDRLDPTLTAAERISLWGAIRMELTTGWQTEDHPREKLTVADEREHVLFYLTEILYRVIPAFYEEIAQAIEKFYAVPAQQVLIPTLLRFATWVGGDMDGHPDVHAKSIRETLARQQQVIVSTYFNECIKLSERLSQSASRIGITAALTKRIDEYSMLLPEARAATPSRHDRMPYRVFLAQLGERLRRTYDGRANGYGTPQQFRADIQLIADSLHQNKGEHAGLFMIKRLLRRIDAFGFHVASLDIRQRSTVYHQVLARSLDEPRWLEFSSIERQRILSEAIIKDTGPRYELDALGRRTLAVFEAASQSRHRYGERAIGYCIISGVQGPDDILAALLLARWAEAYDKRTGQVALDFAPLFDSMAGLQDSARTMQALLSDPAYRQHLGAGQRRQCVLVGYSNSSKEGGICASRFANHRAQSELAGVLRSAGYPFLVCHARGGSIARGGGRIDVPMRTTPADAVNGILRVTEQGEVLQQSYGLRPIAMRTLERAFNALSMSVASVRHSRKAPQDNFLACIRTVADASLAKYRETVGNDPRFYDYFREVTPIDVIERMQIGLRPVHLGTVESVASIRTVHWVFAWTQNRYLLPGWFGAGSGLAAATTQHGVAMLQAAYRELPFMRTLIDDIEAMLARADLSIAAAYEVLVQDSLRYFCQILREEYALARQHVLAIKQLGELLDGEPTLQRSIALRNPYVDPMNLMQVDLLRRWRSSERQDRDLFDALLASIGGIAQGLQSTG